MSSVLPKKSLEKGNFRIRNLLANIERTFLPVGSTIGKYRIIDEIDRGGMAVVYKALQLDLDREVALKVMPANITINHKFVDRFLSEAHAVARLSHPNIVSIHEVAMESNIYYLAMDYIPGENLFYYLNFHKPKLVDVLEIVSRLADALAYAHRQRIIHRDLKLNNVIMRDRLTPVLIDFGLAKAMENDQDGGITRTGEIMGSPSYMAPERLLGGIVDHRSDICSLGIMLYEMLTFKNPYLDQRNLHQTTLNVMEANPIPPRKLVPWLPLEIEAITLKAMAKDMTGRYQSMEEFREDINRYQRSEPVLARPPSFWFTARRFTRRHWAPLAIGGLVFLFTTFFSWYLYSQSRKEQSHWQLVFSSQNLIPSEWSFISDHMPGDTLWRIDKGAIETHPRAAGFARLERQFNRDLLVELDLHAAKGDLANAGIFLFGDRPDSGYCFHINKDGTGLHGVTMPGSKFPLRDIEAINIPFTTNNRISVERIQNSLTFRINGVTVARIWDYLPPLGKSHEQLGFFVNGCAVKFANIRVYRRAIPLVPSPTLVADRFWERGDIEAALEEYRGLLLDLGSSGKTEEIMVKIADCLLRLGRIDEAKGVLSAGNATRSNDEEIAARAHFLHGAILTRKNQEEAADSVLAVLARLYPSSPVNLSAMFSAQVRIAGYIEHENLRKASHEILVLEDKYPRYSQLWGKLHLFIMKKYASVGKLDSASYIAESIITGHRRDLQTLADVRAALGRVHLSRGKKDDAMRVLDQCVAAHTSTEGIWEAWMDLAEIYEYNFQYTEAIAVYRKIVQDCPGSSIFPWMAAVKAGELAFADTQSTKPQEYLKPVTLDTHPFPLPRLIAKFYTGQLCEADFVAAYESLHPGDPLHLYHLARNAALQGNLQSAQSRLLTLKSQLPQHSWHYFRVLKILGNISKW